jgi:hypothetical protein
MFGLKSWFKEKIANKQINMYSPRILCQSKNVSRRAIFNKQNTKSFHPTVQRRNQKHGSVQGTYTVEFKSCYIIIQHWTQKFILWSKTHIFYGFTFHFPFIFKLSSFVFRRFLFNTNPFFMPPPPPQMIIHLSPDGGDGGGGVTLACVLQ